MKFLITIFVCSCFFTQAKLRPFSISGLAQGTTYHITYYAPDSLVKQASVDSLFARIDSSLSTYKQYSLISQFNRSEKGLLTDQHLETVVRTALDIWKATGGLSDLTVYPLVSAWGFGPVKPVLQPDDESIRKILPCVGAGLLQLSEHFLLKEKPCVQIDLNGIAQGYTVDLLADFIESRSISNYLVEVGGEIRMKGKKYPAGEPMKLGIEAPSNEDLNQTVLQRIIQPPAGAITTSGNYRKFHQHGGKRVSHLIDPFTGYPFSNELISVTVYAQQAIIADGYDNALMGMGLDKALQFMREHTEMEAYFIYHKADGTIGDTATAGFSKMFL